MGLNAAIVEHVISSLHDDKDWYDFLRAILKVADGSIWPYLKYNFESRTIQVVTDNWVFPETIVIDGGFSQDVAREDFDGGSSNREGIDADAGDALASFGRCVVPLGSLVPGEYKIVNPRVFFEGVNTQKYIDSDFVLYSEEPLENVELMVLDNDFMANTFNLDYKDHLNGDGTGFSALAIPFALASYANLIEGSYMRGNSLDDIVFVTPSSTLYRIYKFSAVYLGHGIFYSEFSALPKANDAFVDLFSVPGTSYANMEVKAVNGKAFSVSMDLDLEVGVLYNNCILRRYRGTYNYMGFYKGFVSIPKNITPEIFEALPIVILPENQSYGLSVSPTYLSFGGMASDGLLNTLQFNVYGNDSYKIITSVNWISVLDGSRPVYEAFGNRRFSVKVTENTGVEKRTGTIMILGAHSNKAVIYVSQDDNLFKSLFSPLFLSVLPGSSGDTKLTIEATTPWTVSCDNYIYGDGHLNVPNVEVTSGGVHFIANGDTAKIHSHGNGTVQFRVSSRSFEFDCQNNYVFNVSDVSERLELELTQDGIADVKSKFTAIINRDLNVAGSIKIGQTSYDIRTQSTTIQMDGYSFKNYNNLLSNTYYTVEVLGVEVPGSTPAGYLSYSSRGNGSNQEMFTVPVNSSESDIVGEITVKINGAVKGRPIRFVQKAFTLPQAIVGITCSPRGRYSTNVLGSDVQLSVDGPFALQKCLRSGAYLAFHLILPENSHLRQNDFWAEGQLIEVSESPQSFVGQIIAPFEVYIPDYPEEYSSVSEVLSNSICQLYVLVEEMPVNGDPVPEKSVFVANVNSWTQ